MVDDDGDGFPSLEPQTDSRSTLLRKNRAWLELRSVEVQGAHKVRGRTPTLVARVWASAADSFANVFY